jgi:hypothetical protein
MPSAVTHFYSGQPMHFCSGVDKSSFAQSKPDGLGHLWSYGLNTWGWDGVLGGGDLDYNDMVVQLDFTSAAGHGLLV